MRWLQFLEQGLREALADAEKTIISGNVSNYDEYRYLRGVVHGLQIARDEAEKVVDRLNRE